MKTIARRPHAIIVTVGAVALFCVQAFAQDGPSPVRMDPDKMAGLGLTPAPNDGFIDILVAGTLEFEVASLFDGEELRAVIFGSTPATTDHRDRPLEYDEFVLVLNGKLILTEQNGTAQEFTPGNAVVLPKGYTGTWEMQGDYRELAVVPRQPDEITVVDGSPVRMNEDNMAGLALRPIPNDAFIDILVEGELEFTIADLFSGEDGSSEQTAGVRRVRAGAQRQTGPDRAERQGSRVHARRCTDGAKGLHGHLGATGYLSRARTHPANSRLVQASHS